MRRRPESARRTAASTTAARTLIGSRMKKTGVLLPVMSQLPARGGGGGGGGGGARAHTAT